MTTRAIVDEWVERKGDLRADAAPRLEASTEALDLFAAGSRLMREGRRADALRAWARGYQIDPRNFVIRKQIWRALYPDRFGEPIDLTWQKEQIVREEAVGFRSANPDLPEDAAVRS